MLYITYLDLSPGLRNEFSILTHKIMIEPLRTVFEKCESFARDHPDYSIIFTISTKTEVSSLEVKGPSINKRSKNVSYVIFLPDRVVEVGEYIDLVFEGFRIVLAKYKVEKDQLFLIRDNCKKELGFTPPAP